MRILKVLITGASGYVGGHLAVGLGKENYRIFALVNKSRCPTEIMDVASEIIPVDLVNSEILPTLKAINPDIIIHAAALAKSEQCEKNPEVASRINKTATERLLSSFNQIRSSRSKFIYISTDLVFDGNDSCPISGFKESDEPKPRSVYAQTKREGEMIVLSMPGNNIVTRTCLVYGNPIGNNQGVLGWLKEGILNNKPVTLFDDEYRTPVLVDDLIEAMNKLIGVEFQILLAHKQQILHFAGPKRISRFEFGKKLCDALGYQHQNIFRAKRADSNTLAYRPADVSLNSEQTCMILGRIFKGVDDSLIRLRP